MENAEQILAQVQELLAVYGLKILAALAILLIGRIAAKWIKSIVERTMTRGKTDPMIIGFVGSIVFVGVMVFVVLAALSQLGIQTTSFIAVLGAAGLAIGLALQGSLSNFAAGFLLIIFRPFKVGDFIEGGGTSGIVENIQIFTTTLRTGDNKTVIVPNAKLLDDNIVNYSTKPTRRVDLTVGVAYDADLAEVKKILADIAAKDGRVKADPAPLIAVSELADNSVNLVMRMWADTSDYWGVYFDTTEAVKLRLDEAGIGIPYPQRDVHLYEHKVA
ncbi:mechanosensitive ion channel family protein [Thiosocius teredinicola]|uniref:mechanosensitive ion channel family protein n=1 Tax=Thiosocius teredinicola TaxID=1973002 RepID=UPI000990E72E